MEEYNEFYKSLSNDWDGKCYLANIVWLFSLEILLPHLNRIKFCTLFGSCDLGRAFK